MKVIFLDLDGVLNTARTLPMTARFVEFESIRIGFNQLDNDAVKQLNRVTDATGAKLVISSSWRIGCATQERLDVLAHHLKLEGVTGEVIGRTPVYVEYEHICGGLLNDLPRGLEIQMWLLKHPEVKQFVIVDDNSDMEHLIDKLVRTNFETGITEKEADRMIEILNRT